MELEINTQTHTIGREILKAASMQAKIKNIIRETNKYFQDIERLKKLSPAPELFNNFKISSLSYLSRKFEEIPNNYTEGKNYYKCKLKVERELNKINLTN